MSFKVKDHFYKKAKSENFYARSVYKLEEIDKKHDVLNSAKLVLDLGYYPGSWVQYVSQKKEFKGKIVGVDIQEVNRKLDSVENVSLFQKSIYDIHELSDLGVSDKFDVLLSDMAPKTTGIKSVDQLKSLELVELVFYKADEFLKKGGNLVVKIFESGEAQKFFKEQRGKFDKLAFYRPKSTRKVSKEYFAIGLGLK